MMSKIGDVIVATGAALLTILASFTISLLWILLTRSIPGIVFIVGICIVFFSKAAEEFMAEDGFFKGLSKAAGVVFIAITALNGNNLLWNFWIDADPNIQWWLAVGTWIGLCIFFDKKLNTG